MFYYLVKNINITHQLQLALPVLNKGRFILYDSPYCDVIAEAPTTKTRDAIIKKSLQKNVLAPNL